MKFLVDAQLPRRIANWLNEEGHDAAPVVQKKKYPLWSPFVVELAATHEHKTQQTLKGYTRLQADNLVGSLG